MIWYYRNACSAWVSKASDKTSFRVTFDVDPSGNKKLPEPCTRTVRSCNFFSPKPTAPETTGTSPLHPSLWILAMSKTKRMILIVPGLPVFILFSVKECFYTICAGTLLGMLTATCISFIHLSVEQSKYSQHILYHVPHFGYINPQKGYINPVAVPLWTFTRSRPHWGGMGIV